MSLKDFALTLVVIVAWGLNFVVSKISLEGVPPVLLGTLRFVLVMFPAIFFFRRPQIPWRWLIAYGLTISMGQFAFIFESIKQGMPAGLASVVLQAQAFFTLILASLLLKEKMTPAGLTGLLVAAGGSLLDGRAGGERIWHAAGTCRPTSALSGTLRRRTELTKNYRRKPGETRSAHPSYSATWS